MATTIWWAVPLLAGGGALPLSYQPLVDAFGLALGVGLLLACLLTLFALTGIAIRMVDQTDRALVVAMVPAALALTAAVGVNRNIGHLLPDKHVSRTAAASASQSVPAATVVTVSSPPPAPAEPPATVALRQIVAPLSYADTCVAQTVLRTGVTASLLCSPPQGAAAVEYTTFADPGSLHRAFVHDRVAAEQHHWVNWYRWHHNDRDAGSYFIYRGRYGSHEEWDVWSLHLLGRAYRRDARLGWLRRWLFQGTRLGI